MDKFARGRALVARTEEMMGCVIEHNIIDLMFDNAEGLGFSDDDCLEVGNAIHADKGIPLVQKWWK